MDVSPANWEGEFYSYIFRLICTKGGTRLQLCSSDITLEMQKLDVNNCINKHRKQYGNLNQLLKTLKHPFYTYDSNIVKLQNKSQIDKLHQQKHINDQDYLLYQETYEQVQQKLIEVMIINKQNKCTICGEEYKLIINRLGMCGQEKDNKAHIPMYNLS